MTLTIALGLGVLVILGIGWGIDWWTRPKVSEQLSEQWRMEQSYPRDGDRL
jgi:hypothetical protein